MTQDLQQLLEKIQRDGVDKAKSEADKILEKAGEQARMLVDHAKSEATRIISNAHQQAEAFERRAEETMRQAARDTVLTVEKSVTALLTDVLVKDVNSALCDPAITSEIAMEAVRTYLSGQPELEISAAAKLADALRARVAAEAVKGVTVVTDAAAGAGFRIHLSNGRVEHAFTGAAVAEFLARQLRPRLASLMRQS